MVNTRPTPGASQSNLIVLALGLLVGFVIAFVLLLSQLPTDGKVSRLSEQSAISTDMPDINFDYPSVLPEQQVKRKPERQVVVVADPPSAFIDEPEQAVPKPNATSTSPIPDSVLTGVETERSAPVAVTTPAVPPLEIREIPASQSGQDSYYVEAGNYRDNTDALQALDALRRLGLDAFVVVRQDSSGSFGHRVRIGPFLEQSRLDATRDTLRASGINPRLIRVKG